MTRSTATIPVIVCTAATREVREIQGYLQAKGVSLVPKPFDIDDLLAAVKRAFELYGHDADIIEEREENAEHAEHAEHAGHEAACREDPKDGEDDEGSGG